MAVRQRKQIDKTSQEQRNRIPSKKKNNKSWTLFLIIFTFMSSISGIMMWKYYKNMGIYTPLSTAKAVDLMRDDDDEMQRLWGTYRYAIFLCCIQGLFCQNRKNWFNKTAKLPYEVIFKIVI